MKIGMRGLATQTEMVASLGALDAEQVVVAFLQEGRAGQDLVGIVQGFMAQDPSA
jgi:hypothetical protein